MKLRYISALLSLVIIFHFAPVSAQTKHQTKKPAKKTAAKKPAAKKPAAKPVAKAPAKATPSKGKPTLQSAAKKLGGEVTAKTDTGKNNDDNGLTQEIIVTTAYKPVLADAVKIRRNPTLEDTVPFKAPLAYNPLDKRLEQNSEIRQLDAMKMPAARDSDYKNNYVKGGFGSLKSLYGEVYVDNGKDNALQLGGYAKFFSQSGNIYKQNEAKGDVGIFGKSIFDDNAFKWKVGYNYRSDYFYGFDQDNPPKTLDVAKQTFNTFNAEAEIAKSYKDVPNDFTYAVKVKGYVYKNAFDSKENNVVLSGFLNETVNQFYAGVAASVDLSTEQDSIYLNNINNSIVRANPYIKFQGENYKIDAGVELAKEFGYSNRAFIFPSARLELQVIPKYVRLFAEAKGDVNRTSLMDFANINPFINDHINITNSVDKLDIMVGLKGMLAPGLSFKADVFRNSVKNMPLFVNDFNFAAGYNRFTVIYDNGNARINGFNGELDFKESDDVNIYGRMEIKDYQMASEAQAWNLPKFTLTAGTNINISDKVIINGSAIFRGNTYEKTYVGAPTISGVPAGSPISISSFLDVNGGVEYRATDRISVFGQVNNLLNNNHQTWLYYPEYGFNIFGGVKYSF